VQPDDYVRDVGDGACLLLLATTNSNTVTMGLPLYKGYYTVHDDTEGKMGFVPHKGSSKKGPFESTGKPTRVFGDPLPVEIPEEKVPE